MSPQPGEEPSPKVSELFCANDSDITIQSSDGVLFRVHRQNLESHSEVFAGAAGVSAGRESQDDEIVQLTETSTTLELLLQCMYNRPQPDLRAENFDTLARVAEAAEKYQVHHATPICKILMQLAIPKHPLAVLGYATRHGHCDLMDLAAPHTIGCKVKDILATLQPASVVAWFQYYYAFQNVIRGIAHDPSWVVFGHYNERIAALRTGFHRPALEAEDLAKLLVPCEEKAKISALVLHLLGQGPEAFIESGRILSLQLDVPVKCQHCRGDVDRCRIQLGNSMKQIQKYSTFL